MKQTGMLTFQVVRQLAMGSDVGEVGSSVPDVQVESSDTKANY
jgi:hypothetical protein